MTVFAGYCHLFGSGIVELSENAKAWLKLKGQLPPNRQTSWITFVWQAAKIKNWEGNELRHSFASYHLAMLSQEFSTEFPKPTFSSVSHRALRLCSFLPPMPENIVLCSCTAIVRCRAPAFRKNYGSFHRRDGRAVAPAIHSAKIF